MKPVNVLYLVRTWALGGSHTIIRLLLRHLPRDRFNVITVPYDAPGRGDADFIASVRKQGDDVAPDRIPWRSRANWFRARRAVAELICRYDISLIHTHDTNSNVLIGLGRDRWPCACVASPYGWWEPEPRRRIRAYHWIEKNLALPRFDRLITVSHTMKRKILAGRAAADRVKVIHTGLDPSQFAGGQTREAVREELGIAPEDLVIGTVSRLFREKGHTFLLQAAASIVADCPRLRLLIVGTGDQREPLEQEARALGIRDRVTFTGYYEDL
ncbi:MAG TPA: glycosyltransferase, partial [Candidatus Hydrogenedentes bacterium]|nr:glycosyltransferase [Candidatus Hydrogenedentota bacterium]